MTKTTKSRARSINPAVLRLMEAARAFTQGGKSPVENWADLARFIGVTDQVLTNWKRRGLNQKRAIELANRVNCSIRWLNDGIGDMLESKNGDSDLEFASKTITAIRHPVVGEVMGGADGYLEEFGYPAGHGDGYLEYPSRDPDAFALRVRGDSMFPRYRAGEFILVEPTIPPEIGDDVVVICADGRKMLKVLSWKRDDEIQFLSINSGFSPLTLRLSEIKSIMSVVGPIKRSCFVKD